LASSAFACVVWVPQHQTIQFSSVVRYCVSAPINTVASGILDSHGFLATRPFLTSETTFASLARHTCIVAARDLLAQGARNLKTRTNNGVTSQNDYRGPAENKLSRSIGVRQLVKSNAVFLQWLTYFFLKGQYSMLVSFAVWVCGPIAGAQLMLLKTDPLIFALWMVSMRPANKVAEHVMTSHKKYQNLLHNRKGRRQALFLSIAVLKTIAKE